MKERIGRIGWLVLAMAVLPRSLFAQPRAEVAEGATIAVGPTTPPPPAIANDEPWTRFAVKLEGGIAVIPHHVVAGYARLGGEGMISSDPERARFVWGVWDAYEGWFARGAGGFALPVAFYLGYRRAPLIATLGAGLNLFTIDHLDDDTGAGILSPRGDVRFGVELGKKVPVVILATSEIQRRWLWGRDDITMLQFGLSIGIGPNFAQPPPPATQGTGGTTR